MNTARKNKSSVHLPARTRPPSHRGVFITGTDTGVGKTLVTAALTVCLKQRGFSVGVMKPVETGLRDEGAAASDAARLRAAAGLDEAVEAISPCRFPEPLAPADAARRAGQTIMLAHIARAYRALASRYQIVLVEGVGGVRVPLTPQADVSELIRRLGLPSVVVGRTRLGAINHALLTLDALAQRDLPVLGLLLNRSSAEPATATERLQEASALSLLKAWGKIPVIGPLAFHAHVQRAWAEGLATVANSKEIGALADLIIGRAPRTRERFRLRRGPGRLHR